MSTVTHRDSYFIFGRVILVFNPVSVSESKLAGEMFPCPKNVRRPTFFAFAMSFSHNLNLPVYMNMSNGT